MKTKKLEMADAQQEAELGDIAPAGELLCDLNDKRRTGILEK